MSDQAIKFQDEQRRRADRVPEIIKLLFRLKLTSQPRTLRDPGQQRRARAPQTKVNLIKAAAEKRERRRQRNRRIAVTGYVHQAASERLVVARRRNRARRRLVILRRQQRERKATKDFIERVAAERPSRLILPGKG